MKFSSSNFERARALSEKWPEWKRSYELTKNSVHSSTHTNENIAVINSNSDRDVERKVANSEAT